MESYDPLEPPDPQEWLSLDEQERISLIEQFHQRKRVRLPNLTIHAIMHAIVENQIAMGDELPVRQKLEQLMDEGLNRHEAVHAIGWILSNQMFRAMRSEGQSPDWFKSYIAALEDLTAENWRRSGED